MYTVINSDRNSFESWFNQTADDTIFLLCDIYQEGITTKEELETMKIGGIIRIGEYIIVKIK